MDKRVFIVHGWNDYPEDGWFPWLKKELEAEGWVVTVPAMPKPEASEMNAWVNKIKEVVGEVDENTFLVGHCIGCLAIIRFLEELPEDRLVGGVMFVAGWTHLTPEEALDWESKAIAKSWIEYSINWERAKSRTHSFVAIFSDNDPLVPITEKDVFEEKLGAKIIIESSKGHINGEYNVNKLPVVLEELNRISRVS